MKLILSLLVAIVASSGAFASYAVPPSTSAQVANYMPSTPADNATPVYPAPSAYSPTHLDNAPDGKALVHAAAPNDKMLPRCGLLRHGRICMFTSCGLLGRMFGYCNDKSRLKIKRADV